MIRFLLKRLARAIGTIILISMLVFAAARLSGDPVLQLLPEDATAGEVAQLRAELGLDETLAIQYARFVQRALAGEFGDSIRYREPAFPMVVSAIPATLQLGLTAFLVSKLVGISLGVLLALRRGTAFDHGMRGLAVLADSAPGFWVGMMLILLFSVQLQWLPSNGRLGIEYMILPVAAISISSVAAVMRLTRSSMLETLSSDYIRFLRSRGMRTRTIVWKHALRNAAIPVVAVLGIQLGHLISGTVIIETVFNWPGVGRMMVEALNSRDFAVIQAGALLISVVTVSINLLVDVLFGLIDPRIRYE